VNTAPAVSVVVPVHDEEGVIESFHERLVAALDPAGITWEVVYVDDGSSDASAAIIGSWATADSRVTLVRLSRNFGMDVAMSAGIDHAGGQNVALIHADLQDPPELIPQMYELISGADVVYARRIGSDESGVKKALATGFYNLMERIGRVPYQGQAGDFRMMSRRVVDALRAMPERRRFLRGMVAWVGFRQIPIEYRRAGRASGRGASYPELFRLALEAVASFSDVPLNLAAYFGLFCAVVSATVALVLVVLAIAGVATNGTALILIAVLFIGGVQLITVGILGRYLARVHEESLRRPLYVVEEVVGRDGAA
jgi:glycosyltransferase involved in cell wall biosynthesis